jgi:predicted HicB family RNase H-like nuclease
VATESRKIATPKFPLRLMPSVRRTAEEFSEKEGVSLNQFINVAVAEKLAHLETRNGRESENSRRKNENNVT